VIFSIAVIRIGANWRREDIQMDVEDVVDIVSTWELDLYDPNKV
jgi:hypothetical protein